MLFDGYRIVRELHASSRSHIYLAVDTETEALVAIKIPSIDLRDDPAYLKRFMMEEWVARRIDSPHVLKPRSHSRKRNYLYVVTEFIDGQTLTQWMIDNPKPDLETVRGIVEQIASGLRAFHRMEMLHQDLRPDNIMIDKTGTVKIIDFGSTKIAGVAEADAICRPQRHSGHRAIHRARIFPGRERLAALRHVLARRDYLSDADRASCPTALRSRKRRTKSQLRQVEIQIRLDDNREIPAWIDGALRKAVHPDPYKRYESLSEFMFDLRHPNANYLGTSPPLIERNPLLFWKCATAILACVVIALLAYQHGVSR